jgi:flavin-dependent dehydrogenase
MSSDAVIVGGGAAGAVLASRLSQPGVLGHLDAALQQHASV